MTFSRENGHARDDDRELIIGEMGFDPAIYGNLKSLQNAED